MDRADRGAVVALRIVMAPVIAKSNVIAKGPVTAGTTAMNSTLLHEDRGLKKNDEI